MKKIEDRDRVLAYFATAPLDEVKSVLSSVGAIVKNRTPKAVRASRTRVKKETLPRFMEKETLPRFMEGVGGAGA